jgi:acetyl/propionyl-CoA carboxylase alpha subunit
MPDIGNLKRYRLPKGEGVRVDDGYREGMDMPIYYDPMLAKLITFGEDREQARLRMLQAIQDYKITGVENTLGFCRFVLEHPAFIDGRFDTGFVGKYFSPEKLEQELTEDEEFIAGLAVAWHKHQQDALPANKLAQSVNPWSLNRSF